jgi:hypothetical protein
VVACGGESVNATVRGGGGGSSNKLIVQVTAAAQTAKWPPFPKHRNRHADRGRMKGPGKLCFSATISSKARASRALRRALPKRPIVIKIRGVGRRLDGNVAIYVNLRRKFRIMAIRHFYFMRNTVS